MQYFFSNARKCKLSKCGGGGGGGGGSEFIGNQGVQLEKLQSKPRGAT